jgi:hypothetical protein
LEKRLAADLANGVLKGSAALAVARGPDPVPREAETQDERAGPLPKTADEGLEEEAERAWPGEADEAAFLAGEREQFTKAAGPGIPPAAETAEVAERGEPPPLEELVQRIAPEIRAALEELFRARFTRATRVRVREKKAGPEMGPA